MATFVLSNDADVQFGTSDADGIFGLGGDDLLAGQAGNDTIQAGPGNDAVFGQEGADELDGGTGDDLIAGGPDNDTLTGGAGTDVLYIERFSARDSAINHTVVGGRIPLYASCLGLSMLAHADHASVEAVLAAGLQPYTDRTITSSEALSRELARVRARDARYAEGWRAARAGDLAANDYAARSRDHDRAMASYARSRAAYERAMVEWRQAVAACRAGDYSACER